MRTPFFKKSVDKSALFLYDTPIRSFCQEETEKKDCFRCAEYPCDKYEQIDEYDSFISHRNQKANPEKARQVGIETFNGEQKEKVQILGVLLSDFNDGRKKTLFCQEVNLLELCDLRKLLSELETCFYYLLAQS